MKRKTLELGTRQRSLEPFGPEMSKKSRRRRPRNPEKSPESLGNTPKRLFRHFPETIQRLPRVFPRLFGVVGVLRQEAPRDIFEIFSAFRARRARETSVRGGLVPNAGEKTCDAVETERGFWEKLQILRFLRGENWATCQVFVQYNQDDGKGGLSLRGVAFMTVLAVLESTLPSFCLCNKIQCQETFLTVLAVLAVVAVSVVAASP